jgi:hypothetical protein
MTLKTVEKTVLCDPVSAMSVNYDRNRFIESAPNISLPDNDADTTNILLRVRNKVPFDGLTLFCGDQKSV